MRLLEAPANLSPFQKYCQSDLSIQMDLGSSQQNALPDANLQRSKYHKKFSATIYERSRGRSFTWPMKSHRILISTCFCSDFSDLIYTNVYVFINTMDKAIVEAIYMYLVWESQNLCFKSEVQLKTIWKLASFLKSAPFWKKKFPKL